jgi:hypothetical protein
VPLALHQQLGTSQRREDGPCGALQIRFRVERAKGAGTTAPEPYGNRTSQTALQIGATQGRWIAADCSRWLWSEL